MHRKFNDKWLSVLKRKKNFFIRKRLKKPNKIWIQKSIYNGDKLPIETTVQKREKRIRIKRKGIPQSTY